MNGATVVAMPTKVVEPSAVALLDDYLAQLQKRNVYVLAEVVELDQQLVALRTDLRRLLDEGRTK